MKKFKFRMQPILEIREKKLEDERLKLAELQNILNSQIDILNEMEYKKRKLIERIDVLQNGETMAINEICNCRMFLERINSDIQTQLGLIKKTQIKIEEQKKVMTIVYQELKTLENLKEKQETEHLKHFEKLEMKEIDDIAISRYKNKN
ncbi:flagellar export protein FliJ [bacterium]|nr:flagellar export protein FliJ [bacterium]